MKMNLRECSCCSSFSTCLTTPFVWLYHALKWIFKQTVGRCCKCLYKTSDEAIRLWLCRMGCLVLIGLLIMALLYDYLQPPATSLGTAFMNSAQTLGQFLHTPTATYTSSAGRRLEIEVSPSLKRLR